MDDITRLWETHQKASWPESLGTVEGELMMLDTVIAGCVTYFVDEENLDQQRVGILEDSLSDLDDLLPALPDQALQYFERLRTLGSTILEVVPREEG